MGRQRPSKRIAGAINDEDHRILVMSATAFGLVATGDSGQPDALAVEVGSAAVAVSKMRAEKVSSRPEADIRFAIYILLSLNPENGESNLQGLPPDRLTKFLSDVRDKDLCKHLLQSELHVTIRLPVHA